MKRELEYRTIKQSLSLRKVDDNEPSLSGANQLCGYAAMFDELSEDLGGYREKISHGAFANSIANNDIRAFYNHCFDHLLGRTKSGTLRLNEDDKGLAFEIDLADTTLGNDLHTMVLRGDLDGVSFGFYVISDEWSDDGLINTILEADLIEISPVVFPAYASPKVEARSLDRLALRPDPNKKRIERAKAILEILS